jgi:hypothetical protein
MTPNDFRSVRVKLPPEAFALSTGEDPPPSDLIPEETWDSIIHLPDDVSLRTSDHYGTSLKDLWDFWGDWVTLVLDLQGPDQALADSPIARVALESAAYFQASVHNALVGYYRLAFTSLRGVVENMTMGLHFELTPDRSKFASWLAGDEVGFGWAADQLRLNSAVAQLEGLLKSSTGDDLFRQRNVASHDEGGLIRCLFRELSKYAHGGPNYTDADLWASNGPIFVRTVFEFWAHTFVLVYALGLLQIQLARPNLKMSTRGSRRKVKALFETAVLTLAPESDERRILQAVPAELWQTGQRN